jgi:uncharacterized RDD family membrane protein YckC
MSNMPQGDEPGQWGSTQQSARPGEWNDPGAQPGTMPGQQDYGQTAGGVPGQPGTFQGQQGRQEPGQSWGGRPGTDSPVNEAETRVTGRRVVQYLIDAFLVGVIPALVSWPFDRSSRTSLHVIGGIIAFALFVLIGLWYWVIRPHSHHGQTFGMQLLGLRVISKDGGPANMTQLFIRWICLIFDAIPYSWPFTGLVGFVVIICSRHRQRIGDHLARTLVISTGMLGNHSGEFSGRGRSSVGGQPMGGQSDLGGQSGTGGQPGSGPGAQL